jgi:hypothetical protein
MMMIHRAAVLATILAILPAGRAVVALEDDDAKGGIDAEGYIGSWLVLSPIKLDEGQGGAEGLAKEQVKDEADLKPKAGDKVEVAGKELAWKAAEAEDGVVDFNKIIGEVTEQSVAYAVSYLESDEDQADVTFKVGSDDQVRVYLNGKRVHSNDEARPFEKDEDTIAGLSLKKGRNVLVLKVVNEGEDWSGSVRVLDKDGAPIKGLKATTKAE